MECLRKMGVFHNQPLDTHHVLGRKDCPRKTCGTHGKSLPGPWQAGEIRDFVKQVNMVERFCNSFGSLETCATAANRTPCCSVYALCFISNLIVGASDCLP